MRLYLARRYFGTAIVLTLLISALPLAFGASLRGFVPIAISLSAPMSLVIIWHELRNRYAWVLYDNLRIRRSPILLACALAFLLAGVVLRSIL